MARGLGILGLGLGAGLMYLLDPDRGRSRRALVRDKALRVADATTDALGAGSRDLSARATGLAAGVRSRLQVPPTVSDEVLVARVRSKLGRVVSHPHALKVTAYQGGITLSGPILAREVPVLLVAVHAVPGVVSVDNQLDVHERPGNVSSLQGGRLRQPRTEIMQENWSPGIRLLVGTLGGSVALAGLARRGVLGALASVAGMGLVTRAVSNLPLRSLTGGGMPLRGIHIQKTVTLDAPLDRVFEFWRQPENFPCFMRHLSEVRDLGDGHHHWVMVGPGGLPVQWDTQVTRIVPNSLISWRNEPGSMIEQAGTVHVEPAPEGGTRVHIQMDYRPPAGAIGHAVAALFGADPKHAMDRDFGEMKAIVEAILQRAPS